MSELPLVLLGILPIFIIFLFLVVLRWSARNTMILSFISVFLIAYFVWKVPFNQIAASSVEGLTTAVEILYIIFGAILLLQTVKESGALAEIRQTISGVTMDRRIQVIIFVWIFGAFFEGAAGWGSTGAVLGPFLVTLGFPAMAAAMSIMIFQSMSVSFGAVGTPVIIGISTGLGNGNIDKVNAILNGMSWNQFIYEMGIKVALLHGIVGLFIPLILVVLLTRFFGKNRSAREGFRAWKFALFGGLCISVPYVLTAVIFGPEFPSVFGGLIGVIPAVIAAKKGWFMPKDTVWEFEDRSKWEKEWISALDFEDENDGKAVNFSALRIWTPYILMAVGLFAIRLEYLPFGAWLKKFTISFTNIFGTEISPAIEPLFAPGTLFIVLSLLTYFLHKMDVPSYSKAFKSSSKVVIGAGTALVFAVPMVEIFLNSGGGAAGYESIPTVLANGFSFVTGGMWAYVAPVIGGMGAFLAGSNTFSNMMFSLFQFEVAQNIGIAPTWIVALQSVGAAAGNMICVHNVVMASAAVGLAGREGDVIRKVIFPLAYYILFTASIGYVIINGFGFNFGSFMVLGIVSTIIISIIMNNRPDHPDIHSMRKGS